MTAHEPVNSANETFTVWKQKVDKGCNRLCGLSCDDLPDVDYYIMWSMGFTPLQAARQTIRNAKVG